MSKTHQERTQAHPRCPSQGRCRSRPDSVPRWSWVRARRSPLRRSGDDVFASGTAAQLAQSARAQADQQHKAAVAKEKAEDRRRRRARRPGARSAAAAIGSREVRDRRPRRRRARAWTKPVSGKYELSAGFGNSGGRWAHKHSGQDFAVPTGTPVKAVHGGTVVKAGPNGAGDGSAYGNAVVIKHERQHVLPVRPSLLAEGEARAAREDRPADRPVGVDRELLRSASALRDPHHSRLRLGQESAARRCGRTASSCDHAGPADDWRDRPSPVVIRNRRPYQPCPRCAVITISWATSRTALRLSSGSPSSVLKRERPRMHGEQRGGAAHLIGQRGVGDLRGASSRTFRPVLEVLADAELAHRRLVLLHEPEQGRGVVEGFAVAPQHLQLRLQGPRAAPWPRRSIRRSGLVRSSKRLMTMSSLLLKW